MTSRTTLLLALLFLTQIVSANAQAPEDPAINLVGTWRLVSWERQLDDGTVIRDQRTVGFIMYSDTGHVCWASMDPGRPEWETWLSPTPTEALSGLAGFAAYCGRAEIHTEEGYVLHHVEVDRVPNNVGTIRKRTFEFTIGGQLALSVDPSEFSLPVVSTTLIFERVTGSE